MVTALTWERGRLARISRVTGGRDARAPGEHSRLPSVVRRVPFFDGDKRAAAGVGDLSARLDRRFDDRAVIARFDDLRANAQRRHWSGTFQKNVKVGR